MDRRKFLSLTGTFTGGVMLLPDFLDVFSRQDSLITGTQSVVFIQLNGGNDGLNTFIPFDDPLYYALRPTIGIPKDKILQVAQGMGFHPALSGFAQIQQDGNLSVIQNVGYPQPVRSHFRSQEIWHTATDADKFSNQGWLGHYLDLQCSTHQPTAGINLDGYETLAFRATRANSISLKNPDQFKVGKNYNQNAVLSKNPQLDFARKVAGSVVEGADEIQKALKNTTPTEVCYPKTGMGRNLEWMAKLIKGRLNTKVYYTSQNGYDTHDNQLGLHKGKLSELNEAVWSFYTDLKQAKLLQNVTLVIFSEFGRRVKDNGKGTDHGTAAPMFIIGGNNSGKILGSNPDLQDLDRGDLKHRIDFRSVYASILQDKLDFDPRKIGISQPKLPGLF